MGLEEKLNLECSNNSYLIEDYEKEIIGLKEGRSRDEDFFKNELESLKQVNVEEISVLKNKLKEQLESLITSHSEEKEVQNKKIADLSLQIDSLNKDVQQLNQEISLR